MSKNFTLYLICLLIISCKSNMQQADTSDIGILNDTLRKDNASKSNDSNRELNTISFNDVLDFIELHYIEDSLITLPLSANKIDTTYKVRSSHSDYLRESLENRTNNRESYWVFMLNLINNPYFQFERIDFPLIIKVLIDSNKTVNNFTIPKDSLNYVLLDNHVGLYASRKIDKSNYSDKTNQKVLTKIDDWKNTDFYFEHDSVWMLRGIIITMKSKEDTLFKNGFLDYLTKFASDKTYRTNHTTIPLPHEGYTDDMEDVDTIYVTQFDYLDILKDRLFLIRHSFEKDIIYNDTVFLKWSFNDNGVSFGHRFVRENNTWYLDFEWDHSN